MLLKNRPIVPNLLIKVIKSNLYKPDDLKAIVRHRLLSSLIIHVVFKLYPFIGREFVLCVDLLILLA